MTKEILVSVKGLQTQEDDNNTVEVISKGEYYLRNGKHYVMYEEVLEDNGEPTKTVIKFDDTCMEVTRKGPVNVHMVFEINKKNVTYYYTPMGSLLIGIEASDIQVEEREEYLSARVNYSLDMNYEHVAECEISLEVRPRHTKEFKLV